MNTRSPVAILAVPLAFLSTGAAGVQVEGPQTRSPLALVGATIIEGTGAPPQPNTTIVIDEGRIADVFPSGSKALPGDATIVQLDGRYIIPGLFDTHAHLDGGGIRGNPGDVISHLQRILRGGVTSVRSMAGNCHVLEEVVERSDSVSGWIPDVYYSAHVIGPSVRASPRVAGAPPGLLARNARGCVNIIDGDFDAGEVASAARDVGATALKLYTDLSAAAVRRLTAEAHRRGLLVWAHATLDPARPGDLVSAGVDVLSHADLFVWEATDQRPARTDGLLNYAAGSRQLGLGLQAPFASVPVPDPSIDDVLERMDTAGTILEPTLFYYEHLASDSALASERAVWRAAASWAIRLTRRAHELGVPIAAGTDGVGAARDGELPNLQRELELLVDSVGLSPLEAIRAATSTAARTVGASDSVGTIAVCKAADLVVLTADPVSDSSNTRRIEMVIKRGVVVR